MPKRTKDYEDGLQERLRDPEYAAAYLKAAVEDKNEHADAVLLLALRDVAEAQQIKRVADNSGLSRETLYRTLSKRGNPTLRSLTAILDAVGLRLSFEIKAEAKPAT